MEVKEIVKAEISRANKWYIQNIHMIYKTMIKSEEEASPNVAQNLVGFHLRFLVRCLESKPSAVRCCSTSASSAHSYRRVWRLPSCSRRWVCPANAHCKAGEEEGGISEGFLALVSLQLTWPRVPWWCRTGPVWTNCPECYAAVPHDQAQWTWPSPCWHVGWASWC